jgi:pimeloyl-ACP methyl ester carboxylesterase
LRKGQAFSVARREQAIAFAEQYQQAGCFCILVEQDGMLTLCREEAPKGVDQPPQPPADGAGEAQTSVPVTRTETPSSKPLRWHFLFAPKVSTPLLPERYRRLPKEDQEVAQLLCHVRQHFPKRQLRVDGLTWEYWAGGSGATGVLFLPGTVPFGDMWFAYLHHWQGDFRLIAPTYPAASRMEQLVEGIRQILKQEQLQRVHLIGQSLGGMVALALWRQYPVLLERVILSHTGIPSAERLAQARRKERQLQGMTLGQITTLAYQSIVHKHLVQVPHREFWRAYFQEALTQRMSKTAFIHLNCRVVADFCQHYRLRPEDFDHPSRPVLLVHTDNDTTFTPAERAALHDLCPTATTLTHTGTGHYSLLVASDVLMPQLAAFLR